MSVGSLTQGLLWLLALVGIVALALGAMLAQPVKSPPPLESIHGGAMAIPQDGKPELSRFQARDGTWLAYRLYPAADGGREKLAIVYHGSSASSDEMNATALTLAKAGFVARRSRYARPRRLGLARRHRLYRPARGRSRRSRRPSARRLRDRTADALRPFLRRRLRLARRRRAGRRVLRPLRAARALSRISRADQPSRRGAGALGRARPSTHRRADDARARSESIGRSRCRRSPSPTAPRRRWRRPRAIPTAC